MVILFYAIKLPKTSEFPFTASQMRGAASTHKGRDHDTSAECPDVLLSSAALTGTSVCLLMHFVNLEISTRMATKIV